MFTFFFMNAGDKISGILTYNVLLFKDPSSNKYQGLPAPHPLHPLIRLRFQAYRQM